ncbi:hypothetical protein FisN_2Lh138 [Fistulifera solaris]|uniref:Uncharacterized protein n=1 Tax=Fistulifera solaris TaxID=1519565 RepID=A0A1Z5JXK1_FISSO|nr:hypothetical protein FisN_2Lh138 [Fistulifera solaris]|eukprot:GAX18481.1 hypothetical protein FisN_2Lh138 [Fistulifera solaris]
MTAAFPLVSDTTGTRTTVPPILLSRLQYQGPAPLNSQKKEEEKEQEGEEEDVRRAVQRWKSQFLLKPTILSPPPAKHASPQGTKTKKDQGKSPPRKHGLVKVARPTRKPGLKFKGQG